jgi:hypothetical protein
VHQNPKDVLCMQHFLWLFCKFIHLYLSIGFMRVLIDYMLVWVCNMLLMFNMLYNYNITLN